MAKLWGDGIIHEYICDALTPLFHYNPIAMVGLWLCRGSRNCFRT